MRKVLITGGAGFIGSNFTRFLLDRTGMHVTVLDKLTYAGNLENLAGLDATGRFEFVRGSICDRELVEKLFQRGLDAVLNFAAESHVDRSILRPASFIETNIIGTEVLLEAARRWKMPLFVQISTDEVYGSCPEGSFTEASPLAPSSPYSASKASADLLVQAYAKTYGLNVIITRSSNNYGPYQFPEKLIPLLISNALRGLPLPIYGDGLYVRDWIYVLDHCRALLAILERGRPGEIYNIGARSERTNLEIARIILSKLGLDESLIEFVEDRPGHDRRYSLDPSKIESELGWRPEVSLEQGLELTIRWYQENKSWVDNVRSGEYTRYYEQMYIRRRQTLAEL